MNDDDDDDGYYRILSAFASTQKAPACRHISETTTQRNYNFIGIGTHNYMWISKENKYLSNCKSNPAVNRIISISSSLAIIVSILVSTLAVEWPNHNIYYLWLLSRFELGLPSDLDWTYYPRYPLAITIS
jgi:hypothetical protein